MPKVKGTILFSDIVDSTKLWKKHHKKGATLADRPCTEVGKIGCLANKTLPIFMVSRNAVINSGYIFAFYFCFEDAQ